MTSMGYDKKDNYKAKRGPLSKLMTEEDKKKVTLLADEKYQKKMAFAIMCGIITFQSRQ